MAASLNVIALISGGKDSLFSVLHCLANNHNVVALANLYPPSPTPTSFTETPQDTDLNSYMYQTAGHNLLPHYSTALSIPLYRAPIIGSAVNTERDYSKAHETGLSEDDDEDETESLIPLLKDVLLMHPSANALSTGAILSTYQRTRIENVALRLDLVPLSYLWQYPLLPSPLPSPGGLLEDMKVVGMKAQIVKVASGGLDEGMLWQDVLSETGRKRIERAMAKFGGSVLGEGGEYETLVLDGPVGVWNGKIMVEEAEMKICQGDGGEAWIVISGGRVVKKTEGGKDEWRKKLKIPQLFDARFEKVLEKTQFLENESIANNNIATQAIWTHARCFSYSKFTYTVSNMTERGEKVEEQIAKILDSLDVLLQASESNMNDVVFTTILLRNMSDFSVINEIYSKRFIKPNPPARVTVACGDTLPNGALVMLSVIIRNAISSNPRQDFRGLHVQSRSYWAPANIGPYSQAISMKAAEKSSTSIVFVAGQIPLIPASMEVVDVEEDTQSTNHLSKFHKQAVLSIQHLWRVGLEMKVTWWSGAIAFIAAEDETEYKAATAWKIWEGLHLPACAQDIVEEEEEAGGPDAWDRKYGDYSSFLTEENLPRQLPDFEAIRPVQECDSVVPGFFAVQVDEIPRACEIEWQSIGITSDRVEVRSFEAGGSKATICSAVDKSIAFVYVSFPYAEELHELHAKDMHDQAKKAIASQELVAVDGIIQFSTHTTIYTSRPSIFRNEGAQLVPCRRVWGPGGEELSAGLVLRLEQYSPIQRL